MNIFERLFPIIMILILSLCLCVFAVCGGAGCGGYVKQPGDEPGITGPGGQTAPGEEGSDIEEPGGEEPGGEEPGGEEPGGEEPGGEEPGGEEPGGEDDEPLPDDGGFEFTLTADGKGYEVTGYGGAGGAAEIPAVYNGLPVRRISGAGSTTAYKIVSLYIPDSVETIDADAFEFCYSLAWVRLPSSLTSIGMRAFYDSYNLIEICNDSDISLTFGSSSNGCVAKYAKNIYSSAGGGSKLVSDGDYIFYDDAEEGALAAYTGTAKEITLPQTTPGGNAYDVLMNVFCFSAGLTAIDMSAATIYELGGNTNGNLGSLTSVALPKTLRSVGPSFFAGSRIAEIELPEGLLSIGNSAFSGCSELSEAALPSSLTDIGIEAFKGTAITEISIPSGVSYLKNGLCENCPALASADLPETLQRIGDRVFKGSEKLTEVNMPSGVTEIGVEAFYGCRSLKGFISDGDIRFYLPEGVTAVSEGCFAYCPLETSLTIPETISSVGDAAFRYTYLEGLTIPETLRSIGAEAFEHSKLKTLTIPDSLGSLGENAFAAGEFISASVPAKFIYNIGAWLGHAVNLQILTIVGSGTVGLDPDGNAVSAPLGGYDGIEEVTIGDAVTGIAEAAFAGIMELKTVTIGEGVESIGDNAFGLDGNGCYMLETVNIGSGVRSIGKRIFEGWNTAQHATGRLTVNYAGGQIFWNEEVTKAANWYYDVPSNRLTMNYNVAF